MEIWHGMRCSPPQQRFSGVGGTTALYLLIATFLGAASGIGVFTFGYADGAAYLTNRPEACANCHVMNEQLDAWIKSSHGKFATCNDCHAPHDFAGKYYCKARNGFFHSLAFTTGHFPDQIQMHRFNKQVVEANCRYCHSQLTHQIEPLVTGNERTTPVSCLHCHADVGHDT
jgi:cytochrome c nitrite reductase small subunit